MRNCFKFAKEVYKTDQTELWEIVTQKLTFAQLGPELQLLNVWIVPLCLVGPASPQDPVKAFDLDGTFTCNYFIFEYYEYSSLFVFVILYHSSLIALCIGTHGESNLRSSTQMIEQKRERPLNYSEANYWAVFWNGQPCCHSLVYTFLSHC